MKREVTRVVTPGTLTDDALLDPRESNFLAAVLRRAKTSAAWPGSSSRPAGSSPPRSSRSTWPTNWRGSRLPNASSPKATRRSPSRAGTADAAHGAGRRGAFLPRIAAAMLLEHFGTATLEGFGWNDDVARRSRPPGALLEYVHETQKSTLHHIARLEPFVRGSNLLIDEATRRSLELVRTLRDDKREGSLLAVIDETVTPMGARLLADWLSNPLTDVDAINRRLDAVAGTGREPPLCPGAARDRSKSAYDLQRLTARVATGPGLAARLAVSDEHARIAPQNQGQALRPPSGAARPSSKSRSICAPTCGRRSKPRWWMSRRCRSSKGA